MYSLRLLPSYAGGGLSGILGHERLISIIIFRFFDLSLLEEGYVLSGSLSTCSRCEVHLPTSGADPVTETMKGFEDLSSEFWLIRTKIETYSSNEIGLYPNVLRELVSPFKTSERPSARVVSIFAIAWPFDDEKKVY